MLSTKKAIGLSVWLALKLFFKNQYLHLISFCLISDKPICLLWCLSHLTKGIAILQSVNDIMWFSTTFPKPPFCNSATVTHTRNIHILAEPTLCFRNNKKKPNHLLLICAKRVKHIIGYSKVLPKHKLSATTHKTFIFSFGRTCLCFINNKKLINR